jgi:hypothetical protein
MKKIVLGLLIALMAFAFMGCPTVYDDIDYDNGSVVYYGAKAKVNGKDTADWGVGDANGKFTWSTDTMSHVATIEFTEGHQWSLYINGAQGKGDEIVEKFVVGKDLLETKDNGFGGLNVVTKAAGTYKLSMDLVKGEYSIEKQ